MYTRRHFVKRFMGACASVLVFFSPAARVLRAQGRRVLPQGTRATTLYQENPANLDIRNLEVTPMRLFGAMGQTMHTVDLAAWRLKVHGAVELPLALSYEDITALPALERRVLLICPETFSFVADWKGVSLRAILQTAQARRGVTRVEIRSADDLIERREVFDMTDILQEKVFLAYAVNGERLPEAHGFPLRVVAEDRYGNHWVKYVESVEALTD